MRTLWLPALLSVVFASSAYADNLCATFGYSGKPANAMSCTFTSTQRTVVCMQGYVVAGTNTASITLQGSAPFPGCVATRQDMCQLYGYSTRSANVASCTTGSNQRTIRCRDGYHVSGTTSETITLTGDAAFPGCSQLTAVNVAPRPTFTGCALYGVPGKPANTNSCVWANNQHTITCKDGWVVNGTAQPTITIPNNAKFAGCSPSACTQYGYSGKDANTASCTNGVNQRTIACQSGFVVKGTTNASITLTGNAAFAGCESARGNRNCGDHNNDGHDDCGQGNGNNNGNNR